MIRRANEYSEEVWNPLDVAEGDARCDQCKETVPRCVHVGEPTGYETASACICRKCLLAALAALDAAT